MERRHNTPADTTAQSPFEARWAHGTVVREERIPPIQKEWVVQALTTTVRLNSEQIDAPVISYYRDLPIRHSTNFSSERLEVNIVTNEERDWDHAEEVLQVLLHGNFRRGRRDLVERHIPYLTRQIQRKTQRAYPVEMVLPTLPFKDQNPLTTRLSPGSIDLGEYLFMSQMRDIVLSVKEAYPPGIRIVLLTDGLVYANIFGNGENSEIENYREQCRQIRDQMGLRGSVEILDMAWLIARQPHFYHVQREVHERLWELAQDNEEVQQYMRSLRHGMLFNIPAPGYTFDEYAHLVQLPEENLPSDVREETNEASFQFASFLLTMQHLRVVSREFPFALRGTVHPKDAPQLPLHLVNGRSRTFPYNGVPLVSEEKLQQTGSLRKATRIVRFYEVLEHHGATAVYRENSTEPFYYLATRGATD